MRPGKSLSAALVAVFLVMGCARGQLENSAAKTSSEDSGFRASAGRLLREAHEMRLHVCAVPSGVAEPQRLTAAEENARAAIGRLQADLGGTPHPSSTPLRYLYTRLEAYLGSANIALNLQGQCSRSTAALVRGQGGVTVEELGQLQRDAFAIVTKVLADEYTLAAAERRILGTSSLRDMMAALDMSHRDSTVGDMADLDKMILEHDVMVTRELAAMR